MCYRPPDCRSARFYHTHRISAGRAAVFPLHRERQIQNGYYVASCEALLSRLRSAEHKEEIGGTDVQHSARR